MRVNVSLALETSEELFLDYENTTTETSLLYNISQNGIHPCSISVVTVDVLAQNKVGIGEAASSTIIPNIDLELCTSSSVVAAPTVTITVVPPIYPGLKVLSTANKNRMLIYGRLIMIIIIEMHKFSPMFSCAGK